jgi:hypothetical protein
MDFKNLYELTALKFQDTEYKRFRSATLQLYKDHVNEAILYIARFLSSDSLQVACKRIGIDPLNYIKKLVTVTPGNFTIAGNVITLPEDATHTPTWLSILYYKINDYPIYGGDEKILRQQKYNSFMEGTAKVPIGYQRGNYMRVFPDYAIGDTNEIGYVKVPDTLVADNDIPEIDLALHTLIADVATGKLFLFDGDDNRATLILAQSENEMKMILGIGNKTK